MALKFINEQYIYNQTDYSITLLDMEDIYKYFCKNEFNENDLLTIKSKGKTNITDTDFLAFKKSELKEIKQYIKENKLSEDEFNNYLSKKEVSKQLHIEKKEILDIEFQYKNKSVNEKLTIGKKVKVDYLNFSQLGSDDVQIVKRIKDNSFFKELLQNDISNLGYCDCREMSNDTCFTFKTKDKNLVMTKEKVLSLLEKYEENENSFIPPPKADSKVKNKYVDYRPYLQQQGLSL